MSDNYKYNILIIDDSITNVVLLNALLSEEGFITQTAFNVPDALKLINKNLPDLVLLDLNLPVVSGFDFLKTVKTDKKISNIPIIVVTAYNDYKNIQQSKALGADDFIEKPVNIDILIKKINNTLKNHENVSN
jgi:CheY-like chemotaxis protein